jgi:phosphatidate cytidylyltransferase
MLLQSSFGVHLPAWWYLPLGVVLSVLAQVGDLAASSMKRWFGIKDFGRIMGPHGGAMDRLDSVLFLTPAVFAFYTIMLA